MARTLLVVDIQSEYFPGGALPLWQADGTEARIVSAIGVARAAGDRIVLVRHVSTAPTGLFSSESGITIRPAILSAAAGAPIVTKHYADAFQETDLAEHLAGTKELLICGMMTQNCVVFTAMSRSAERFDVTVIGDLCAAPSQPVHLIALSALRSKTRVVEAPGVWGELEAPSPELAQA